MHDNKTSQSAQEYDSNIEKTIPYYKKFHDEAIDLVKSVNLNPLSWLDTGCGTGTFISHASSCFKETKFILADPAEAMMAIAREKLFKNRNIEFIVSGTEELKYCNENFHVITAILAHHYFDLHAKQKATENCYRMLKDNGVYITFESILTATKQGTEIGLERWRSAQIRSGKDPQAVERYFKRFGVELLPISIDDHIFMLKKAGFSIVEVFWISGLQAGFYAIK